MSIEDLLEYCNWRWQQQHGSADPPLIRRGRYVEGQFGGVRLASEFAPVRMTESPAVIIGHIAKLRASLSDRWGADALHEVHGRSAVVDFDRLCRTMHMLNYIGGKSEPDSELFLDVDPRHILSVPNDHGAYFADVIHRCGLNPGQVIMTTAFGVWSRSVEATHRLVAGMANYRDRGYRLALKLDERPLVRSGLNILLRVAPDYVRIGLADVSVSERSLGGSTSRDLGHLTRLVAGFGGQVLLEGVERGAGFELAQAAAVQLFEGPFPGRGRKSDAAGGAIKGVRRRMHVQTI
ncbi:MAG: hypothetical protein U1E83_07770 [Methylotetracoccus sp.]